MLIVKANGQQEPFQRGKLERSLRNAGANEREVEKVAAHIESELVDGMRTDEIYRHAFDMLQRFADRPAAARYSLRRAVMDLGPTGFPFEQLISEIFNTKGYKTRLDVFLRGKCARHEIDFIAEREDALILGEAKFHNTVGFKTDLKVVLYIDARFKDIQENQFAGLCKEDQLCQSWLVTNTKFTRNAISYARCSGLVKLIGWNYPKEGNLRNMIEHAGLHPLTCLTTLSKGEKRRLFDLGHVLCRSLKDNEEVLREAGLKAGHVREVLDETTKLCVPDTQQE